MVEPMERFNSPISMQELQRRWAVVRKAMEAEGIDVLLMQNNNDHMGGYVRYFIDVPATNGYPITVVFPRDDDMTVVKQGPFDNDVDLDPAGDGINRGVKRLLTTPSYACSPGTREYDPALVEEALEPYSGGTIGLVCTYQMSFAMVDYLKRGKFSNTKFVEVSDLVDNIKVIKSEEEKQCIRRTAAMQDECMQAAVEAIKPGMKDSDVAAVALHKGHNLGSEQGVYLCASAPIGSPAPIGPRYMQNRVLENGDYFSLLVENNCAGFFTEMGRTIVLGTATDQMKEELAFTLEAQKFTLNQLKPGASCKTVWDSYNEFMRENGRDEEKRLYCHGQGYDMVERPLVRFDETMEIQKDMNIVCHPGYVANGYYSWICDNYLIGDDGAGESVHSYPQEIIEVDV